MPDPNNLVELGKQLATPETVGASGITAFLVWVTYTFKLGASRKLIKDDLVYLRASMDNQTKQLDSLTERLERIETLHMSN